MLFQSVNKIKIDFLFTGLREPCGVIAGPRLDQKTAVFILNNSTELHHWLKRRITSSNKF
jgi:hypothetical protein